MDILSLTFAQHILLVVGAERFMAWVLLFSIAYLSLNMSHRVREDPNLFIPIRGMSVESLSWGVHQFCWWVYHVADKIADVETWYSAYLIVAGLAYIGAAAGAIMIAYPLLHVRFGSGWWLYASKFVLFIWFCGYVIGWMWLKA